MLNRNTLLSAILVITVLIGGMVGCDTTSSNSKSQNGNVELQFKTVANSAGKASFDMTASGHDSLILEGTNGTLKVDDVRFIVSEFEMERKEDTTESDTAEVEMEDFESGPFIIDLPLNSEALSMANRDIPAGFYSELKFKVENLDLESDDEDEAGNYQALSDSIRSVYPDWPDEASMVITGSFTPANSDSAQSFKVFAKAEIEIEREFEPPMEVTQDNVQKEVTVSINPARWFKRADGTVRDLTRNDWEAGQELLEFESEFEDGTEEIEVKDDFDDEEEGEDSDDNDEGDDDTEENED